MRLLLALVLVWLGARPAVAQEGRRSGWLYQTVDSVSKALDLPSLPQISLREDEREIRLWVGFGILHPMLFLRLTETSDLISGQLYWWSATRSYSARMARSDTLRSEIENIMIQRGCGQIQWSGSVAVCRVQFGDEPDWAQTLASLDSLNVMSLPSQGPGDLVTLHGTCLVGEAKRGHAIWNFDYCGLSGRTAHGKAVAAMTSEVWRVATAGD